MTPTATGPAGVMALIRLREIRKADDEADKDQTSKTYEQLVAEFGKLPNGFMALAPIIVPIILMALSSIVSSSSLVIFLLKLKSGMFSL